MPLSPVPASRQSDGKRKIIWLPSSASNPLSLANLTGASAKDLTYSFTPDGWSPAGTQDTVNDPRLTLIQTLGKPGKFNGTLAVKYVESTDTNSAHQILKPTSGSQNGPAGFFVERRGVDNATALAVGDIVDVYTVQMGVPLPDAPTENGVDTKSQGAYLTALTQYEAVLVA